MSEQRQDVTMTAGLAQAAWGALGPIGQTSLPAVTAIRVRRIHRALQGEVEDLTEVRQQILTDSGAVSDGNGGFETEEGSDAIKFDSDTGAESAIRSMSELAETEVTINVTPIHLDELMTAPTLRADSLVILEDAGLLVDDPPAEGAEE